MIIAIHKGHFFGTPCISMNTLLINNYFRCILIRRVCVIVGLLYGYRAVTMIVTVLPSSNKDYHCDEQLNHTISTGEVVHRVLKIMSGFGLSINGQHVYCGDFIFSGHTMILILCYLIIVECVHLIIIIIRFLNILFRYSCCYLVLVAALVALAYCHHRGSDADGVQGALHH